MMEVNQPIESELVFRCTLFDDPKFGELGFLRCYRCYLFCLECCFLACCLLLILLDLFCELFLCYEYLAQL
jgi:hypothetical protein